MTTLKPTTPEERSEVKLTLVRQTPTDYLVSDGVTHAWLPKSRCSYDGDMFYIPASLLSDRGLVGC